MYFKSFKPEWAGSKGVFKIVQNNPAAKGVFLAGNLGKKTDSAFYSLRLEFFLV